MHHLSLVLILVVLALFLLFPWWIALPLCVPILALYLMAFVKGRRAQRQPPTTGEEAMIGAHAVVTDARRGKLEVQYQGERWRATASTRLKPGQPVVIQDVEGLTLRVAPLSPPESEPVKGGTSRSTEMTPTAGD
jgi:membrane protein implicated in regulation of membrane protease activity